MQALNVPVVPTFLSVGQTPTDDTISDVPNVIINWMLHTVNYVEVYVVTVILSYTVGFGQVSICATKFGVAEAGCFHCLLSISTKYPLLLAKRLLLDNYFNHLSIIFPLLCLLAC